MASSALSSTVGHLGAFPDVIAANRGATYRHGPHDNAGWSQDFSTTQWGYPAISLHRQPYLKPRHQGPVPL